MKHRTSILIVFLALVLSFKLSAQEGKLYNEGDNILSVQYVFTPPMADSLAQKNLRTQVEKAFSVRPRTGISTLLLDASTARVRRVAGVTQAEYEVRPISGQVEITLYITPQTTEETPLAKTTQFPILYQNNNSLLTSKFSISQMIYTNDNAWYAQDDKMTEGNPLANNPAGKGYTGWLEGWASGGLYGVTSLWQKQNLYLYGGVSYIVSGSAGRELFTDKTRLYGNWEDAFVGLVGTKSYEDGSRFTYNLSAGRQAFTIGQGFIISNTASNGGERGALQLNPRWASDFLALASVKYNDFLLQAFRIDPNELREVDSKTVINGVNAEWDIKRHGKIGATVLSVPSSQAKYYTPTGDVYSRNGLWNYNLRYYSNYLPHTSGLHYKAEIAYERNKHFDMSAWAGYAELGWRFAQTQWKPSITYRVAYFSGDDPTTKTFERWDPLLGGGNGEKWVLGANHYKIIQNSNMIVHRLQLNAYPTPKTEIVPQLLYMYAPQNNNIGGNPALSYLKGKEYGYETNISFKYFHSKRWYFHGHLAYTLPGSGVKATLNDTKPWFSAMMFVNYNLF